MVSCGVLWRRRLPGRLVIHTFSLSLSWSPPPFPIVVASYSLYPSCTREQMNNLRIAGTDIALQEYQPKLAISAQGTTVGCRSTASLLSTYLTSVLCAYPRHTTTCNRDTRFLKWSDFSSPQVRSPLYSGFIAIPRPLSWDTAHTCLLCMLKGMLEMWLTKIA